MHAFYEMGVKQIFLFSISDSVNETAQNCEERSQVEVNESVANTSGHSEQSSSVEVGEDPEEREENKTASGIHTIYNWMMITFCLTMYAFQYC